MQWKMKCTSLINLERRESTIVGRQVVKPNLAEQKVDIQLVVTEDAGCMQALKGLTGCCALPGRCLEGGWPPFGASQS